MNQSSGLPESQTEMSYANFVSVARDLIAITDTILKNVVSQTEQAALSIGEKVQTISSLSDEQASTIKSLLTNIYTEGTEENKEMTQISTETNDYVDQMVESALNGDFATVESLGNSERYNALKQHSGSLVKQLEKLSAADQNIAEMLGPVIMALQFQDNVRQSLENVIRSFDIFFHTMSCITHEKLPEGVAVEFWQNIEGQFTTTSDRNVVRKVVYGQDAQEEESVANGGGDALFF